MFEYLSQLGNQVVGRYKTLENNIKCRSNSFYDSYLDLFEQTVKAILVTESIGYENRTCGEILREADVINFFTHKINMDKNVFDRNRDHIKKVNEHKHHNEKFINVETVINYLNLYHDFMSYYLSYKDIPVSGFNAEEIKAIYGITQKRSEELDIVKEHYDELTEIMNSEISTLGKRVKALETKNTTSFVASKPPQTNASNKEILNKFLRTSRKSWRWFGTKGELNKSKFLLILATSLMIIIGIITSIISSISAGIYSTFTFFENVGLIFSILIMIYTVKAKVIYRDFDLAHNSTTKYTQDKYGLYIPGKEKLVFRIFRWVAIIATVLSIIYIWIKKSNLSPVATVMELLFLASIIFVRFADAALFAQYCIIYFEGYNEAKTEKVTLVWDPMLKKILPIEEYKKKMPPLFY